MRTLILSVDRDDDLGRKAGIQGPLMGREAVLGAAMRLALADPEDSDANSLFATVSTMDDLMTDADADQEYVCAAITGHRNVGPRSDAIVVDQFERILAELRPDNLILVSDGAEDEHILPMLESRIRINSVRRVVIKQAAKLEGFYYLLVRMFEDEKLQKRFILPASIAIIVFGLAFPFGAVPLAIGAGLVTLGSFLLVHAMQWEQRISAAGREFYSGLKSGKVSFFTTILGIALILFGGLKAYTDIHTGTSLDIRANPLAYIVEFLSIGLWWGIGGLLLYILGKAFDDLVRTRTTLGVYWRLSWGLIAVGFILSGLLDAVEAWRQGTLLISIATDRAIYSQVLLGIFVAVLGSITYRFVRATMREEPEDEEPRRRRGETARAAEPGFHEGP